MRHEGPLVPGEAQKSQTGTCCCPSLAATSGWGGRFGMWVPSSLETMQVVGAGPQLHSSGGPGSPRRGKGVCTPSECGAVQGG